MDGQARWECAEMAMREPAIAQAQTARPELAQFGGDRAIGGEACSSGPDVCGQGGRNTYRREACSAGR